MFPFRKKVGSVDPRPVTPPSALDRALERLIDLKLRVSITEAGGSMQFGYNVPSGGDQVTQMVRIFLELRPRTVVLLYDTINAYSSLGGAAVVEAFEAQPRLRCLLPYVRRMLALDSLVKPTVSYYGAGRGNGVAATMELPKEDGLGQGKVSSTTLWNVTAHHALKKLREKIKDEGLSPAFIDDLTELLAADKALAMFDETKTAMHTVGGEFNMKKMVVRIPAATNAAEIAENAALMQGFLHRGVPRENIITETSPAAERGFELLGVPHGSEEYKTAILAEKVAEVESDGALLSAMGVSHPAEALELLVSSLSKRLGFAARQCNPTSRAVKALAIADKLQLAVVEGICGSGRLRLEGVAAAAEWMAEAAAAAGQPGAQAAGAGRLEPHSLSPFAVVIAGLATRHGGAGLRPLAGLAESGVLHLAMLSASLPKLLDRLDRQDEGAAAIALAGEIRKVETSTLPWAAQAREAYKNVVAAVQPLSPADVALLKELMPTKRQVGLGKKVELPSLLVLVTAGLEKGQHMLSHAVSERELLAAYKTYTDTEHRVMLRTGSAMGATAWLRPLVAGLTDDHRMSRARMPPHLFRMALRAMLGMEPVPGIAAMLLGSEGSCPSCGCAMHGHALSEWAITQHLVACGSGGWWQRIANSFTAAIADCYHDVGVLGACETMGLSATSGHRPGDFVSGFIAIPTQFNMGGNERHAVDTTVQYLTPTAVAELMTGHQQKGVNAAEVVKRTRLNREVENEGGAHRSAGGLSVCAGGYVGSGCVRTAAGKAAGVAG